MIQLSVRASPEGLDFSNDTTVYSFPTNTPPSKSELLYCTIRTEYLRVCYLQKHFHISGGLAGAWAQQLNHTASVSKTARAPSIMIMLWGVNKALFWLVCFGLGAVYPEATKCNLATCEIHILPRGRAKEEKKQAHKILFDWALHTRPLIACDWWQKALEETLSLQCIMGSWPVSTQSCLCLSAMFLFHV